MMEIRSEVQKYGSYLYCHRNLLHARVTAESVMQQIVQRLPNAQRRAFMQWLTQQGPYWEDAQIHTADDWLEVNGEIVTDTAVGETAVCRLRGLARELVSFAPSDWNFTPVLATWVRGDYASLHITIPNHWEALSIQRSLDAHPDRVDSWANLQMYLMQTCPALTFAIDAFESLEGHPFVPSAADRIRILLWTLNKFKGCFDEQGQRNAEGHRLYSDHFTGDKAWFSDSSDPEKAQFREALTFQHPKNRGENLFCSWHGKVKTPQIRIHFSWPIRSDTPLYVVYVGPKLTKR